MYRIERRLLFMDTFRVCANIDLDAFWHNISEIRSNISTDTMIMGVVKANGYGHGAAHIADILIKAGSEWLGVASVDEGIELRNQKIITPILVLGFTPWEQYRELITYKITPTIFSYEMAEEINRVAGEHSAVLDVHIKIDTGMGRIGFKCEEAIEHLLRIKALGNLNIQGIFTHFACSDALDKTSAHLQLSKFQQVISELKEEGIDIPIKHCSNSGAIIDMPEANMDMVRPGISLYGLYPSEEVNHQKIHLKPVMEIKSHIIFIKEVAKGSGIGYGLTFITKRRTRVATIPVGYGDGYPRSLSNKGSVLVRGHLVPIIGRVCMDQFMVDITDFDDVLLGDEVTLIGCDGDERISVEEAANMAGSFNYEFICDVGRRVPRVYYKDQKKIDTIHI